MIAALRAAALMLETGQKLSQLAAVMEVFPQVLRSFKVREKRELQEMPAVRRRIAEVEKALKGRGRVLVRYSGTENKARVMVEGQDEAKVKKYVDEITALIVKEVGA